jgi:F0F1-type ATP synthase delta subunit
MPDGEARGRCAAALEAGAAVLGRDGPGRAGARAFFKDPALPRAAKAEALAALFPKPAAGGAGKAGAAGSSTDGVPATDPAAAAFGRFAALLVGSGRAALLPEIAAAYRALLDAEEGLVRIELASARPLAPEAAEAIGAAFAAELGKPRFVLEASRDPALLGGFVLKAGSVRLDRSAAGRLERLRRELARPLGRGEP